MLFQARVVNSLLTGDAEEVGYHFAPGSDDDRPPIRIFYPASRTVSGESPVGCFEDMGLGLTLLGYLHVAGMKSDTSFFRLLLTPLVQFLSFFLPMNWAVIPGVFRDAPPIDVFITSQTTTTTTGTKRNKAKCPVIVFSHGLMGSGHENFTLLAAWAKKGYVVVSIHHTDGSSSCVPLSDGTNLFYQHGPPYSNYDRNFRPLQVQKRAKEMTQVVDFLQSPFSINGLPRDLVDICDFERIIAAGYSYGAATAALASIDKESTTKFCALLLLDGWFYIDVAKSAGIEFPFPEPAFESGLKDDIPSLFVNTEQFQKYEKLYKATQQLAKSSSNSEMHVVEGTTHMNFVDLVFWVPTCLLRRWKTIGLADPRKAYREVIKKTTTFLSQKVP